MTERGIVSYTDQSFATIKIRQCSACGHDCGECRICNAPEFELKLPNTMGAVTGDTVIIETSSAKILKTAFMLYILPIIGAVFCGFAAYSLTISAAISSAAVIIWLVLWFLYIKHFNRHFKETSRILEVVHEKD